MKRRPKHNKSIILRIFVLVICGYFTFSLADLWSECRAQAKELKARQEELAAGQNEVKELKSILESESDTPLIEKAARERLGYIYSDEIVFRDISGN